MTYVRREEMDEEEFEKKIEFFRKKGQTHTLIYGSVFINGKTYNSNMQKISNYVMAQKDWELSLEVIKQVITFDLKEKVNKDVFKKKV